MFMTKLRYLSAFSKTSSAAILNITERRRGVTVLERITPIITLDTSFPTTSCYHFNFFNTVMAESERNESGTVTMKKLKKIVTIN